MLLNVVKITLRILFVFMFFSKILAQASSDYESGTNDEGVSFISSTHQGYNLEYDWAITGQSSEAIAADGSSLGFAGQRMDVYWDMAGDDIMDIRWEAFTYAADNTTNALIAMRQTSNLTTGEIGDSTMSLSANQTNISADSIGLYGVLNTNSISDVEAYILRQTSLISTNTNTITSNTAAITSNTAAITSNTNTITSNTNTITSNTAAITSNTAAITSNTAAITSNTNTITSNTNTITSNTNTITSNTAAILSNGNAIGMLDSRMDSLESMVRDHARGLASSVAMAQYDLSQNGFSMGIGIGRYKNVTETAIGFGYGRELANGRRVNMRMSKANDITGVGFSMNFLR
jgi:hypothetical protein